MRDSDSGGGSSKGLGGEWNEVGKFLVSCLAMDPTVLPIIKCFCGSLVASISGELHLPL
ncbi:hypothetical protein GLYMA_07G100900v4 [Glycine max]|uniref:Uncharacterized protein n=2 Tax=Glycine subgen. Soja TaxID=1462606 RepID=K7L0T0_SOYBN|nr:hypothetical protein GYH30_017943 [Glycine max]KRH48611.1 hypothetical protein GLYMA_07G100900v4 [Glycine max]